MFRPYIGRNTPTKIDVVVIVLIIGALAFAVYDVVSMLA